MSSRLFLLRSFFVCLIFCQPAALLGQDDQWQDLFDGKTLDGWTQRGGGATYRVENGEVIGTTVPNTPNSFLCTDKMYKDFELQVEFFVDPELNSGIQFRSNSLEDFKNGRVHGYQCEIDLSSRSYSAGIYDEARRGWLESMEDNIEARYAVKRDDWNHLRIRAVGESLQTWINGVPAANVIDNMTSEGFIALQVHGVGGREEPLSVRWRNIRILENPQADKTKIEIGKLIPAATAMDRAELSDIAEGAGAPRPDTSEDKTLTLMLLCEYVKADDTPEMLEEFGFEGATANPAELIKEIMRRPDATFIHDDRLTELTCIATESSARGWFRFDVPELYSGKANFVATKIEDQWKLIEFSMPSRSLHLYHDGELWRRRGTTADPVFTGEREAEQLADGFRFTEGPALGPDGRIYFDDIPNARTHVYDPASGETTVFREETGNANGLFWGPTGTLVSCEGGKRRISRTFDGVTNMVVEEFEGQRLNSPNDLALDNGGGFFFTDPRYGGRDDMNMDVEGVYYVSRSGEISRVIDDMTRPNGVIFSPDFKTLYVADHGGKMTYQYDVTGPGKLENKRMFTDIGSDGMSVDRNGNVYLTWEKAVYVFNPGSQQIDKIEMPQRPTNCVLVGNKLYVTAGTCFYVIETNQQGILN